MFLLLLTFHFLIIDAVGSPLVFSGTTVLSAERGFSLAPVLLLAAMAFMAMGSALVIRGLRARIGVVMLLLFLIPRDTDLPWRCGGQDGAD